MKQLQHRDSIRRSGVALAVCGAFAGVLPSVAAADPLLTVKIFRDSDIMFRDADMARYAENYVELGGGYNSNASMRFGQWSGLAEQGVFGIANFHWTTRKDGEDARYLRLYGANLGLPSRKLAVETGHQGLWNFSASADMLKRSEVEDARFIHNGLGTATLTLPGSFTPTGTANNASVLANLKPFDIEQTRDIYRFGFSGAVNAEWDYRIAYREDRRSGARLTGVPFALSLGGGGSAVIVPYPHEDQTQQVDAQVGYASKVAQFQVGYAYSRYKNAVDALNVKNPFASAPGVPDDGRLSMNPDNDFHQLVATGAYALDAKNRLSAQLTYGVARQNEAYLPYTANAFFPLPYASLDGKVVYTTVDLAYNVRPLDKATVKLAYQYRDNDNQTPRQQFRYVGRDGTTQCGANALTAGCFRQNAPMSSTEHRVLADGDYEILPRTILRLAAERRITEYTLADRKETTTDKLSAEIRRPVSDEFLGSAALVHTRRRGSEYDKNVYFNETYTDTFFKTNSSSSAFGGAGRLTNHPSTRAFLFSDYDENRARLSGNWSVTETVSLQSIVDAFRQKMVKTNCATIVDPDVPLAISSAGTPGVPAPLPEVCLGRDELRGGSLALDLQWQPEENLTTFAFANLSQTKSGQIGRSWGRAAATSAGNTTTGNTTGATNPDWFADVAYTDRALGVGVKWQPVENWDLGSTYVYSSSNEKIELAQSNGAAVVPYPETNSRLHSLQLFAKWDYSKAITWRFNYVYEMLRYADWQLDNADAGSNANILFTGQSAPNYINHVVGVSVAFKTW